MKLRPRPRMKLSTRIALTVGVIVPVLVLAAGWLLVLLVSRDLHTEQDTHLRQTATVVRPDARRLLRVTAAGRPAAEVMRERRLYTSALDVGIRVTGPSGTVRGGPQPETAAQRPAAYLRPLTVRAGGKRWRTFSVRIDGTRPGVHGTLTLFSPDTASQAQLGFVRHRMAGVALLAAPLSALLAWAAASRASRPLRRLQERTSGLDPGSDRARIDPTETGITEVDDLAGTLRTVLARYDEQAARTTQALHTARSFSSTAGHELRTPLMSMQTNLEILAAHPDLDPVDRAEVMDDLQREHRRLLGLLVMLRELGRGDLVEADAFAPLDLAEVTGAAVEDARRRDHRATISVSAAHGLTVHGWGPGVRTLLDNLLANALAHGRGPDGSARVEVGLWPCDSGAAAGPGTEARVAVLTVDDHGPGIPAERRNAVFQRFERGEHSTGSGLGLTLVAQQAALHRAELRLLDRPSGGDYGDGFGDGYGDGYGSGTGGGTGTRFEVRFPLHGGGSALPVQRDWLAGAGPGAGAGSGAGEGTGPDHRDPQGIHKDGS